MATPWCRLWSDMPNDPKWRTIARVSGQPITCIISVYTHMMVCASNATKRGHIEGWCDEDIATALDLETAQVSQIVSAMQGRVLEKGVLTGWDKRQPAREDSSAERAKSWRNKKKEENNRTQPNATERNRTQPNATEQNEQDANTENSANGVDADKDKDTDKEKAAKPQRLTPLQVKEQFQKYAGVVQVGSGQVSIFADLSIKYHPDVIIEAFTAGAAGNKRGPGFLNWCIKRIEGRVQEEESKPVAVDEGEKQLAYIKSLGYEL